MGPVRSDTDDRVVPLDAGWMLAVLDPGAAETPAEADARGDWIDALVPGTAEAALIAAGRLAPGAPSGLHGRDVWYRCAFTAEGPATLRLAGLAGPADVFLDGAPLLAARSMFQAHAVDFAAAGRHHLAIRFHALNPLLASAKGPRQRWRPQMIQPGALRLVRTTPLGHMPGWSPGVAVVGPWQPVDLVSRGGGPRLEDLSLSARLAAGDGVLDVAVRFDSPPDLPVEVLCGGQAQALHPGPDGAHAGRMVLPGIAAWWPHTHGEPALHGVHLRIGDRLVDCGTVGFRTLTLDRGADGKGLGLVVNGVPVFCRGASWMPPDPVSPGGADPLPLLALAREAGMNMIRLSGTITPESRAFHDACDALGILVWHDLPFANFDYPGDDAFRAVAQAEARALLGRLQGSPSLAVVCGGSEIAQQATMLGLTPDQAALPLFDEALAAVAAEIAPQAVYVPHSPWGGALPFVTDEGVTHYFGVGAYCRPIEDARRADVRFASECLAFAAVPSLASLAADGLTSPARERWKDGVPRDAGASWDFEDVRDHYVAALYGVDAQALRSGDPERYLALGRAAPAELMEQVFAEWRRAGSRCAGGLVWFLNDMKPGAGWGVIDRLGQPKTTWHALRRAFRPIHLGITDEGLNGLGIHLVNETAQEKRVRLTLATYGEGVHPLVRAERDMVLAPRSAESLSSFALAGRFFDMAHAYRFGPLAHDATLARLLDAETGALLAEACHVVQGRAATPRDIGLSVRPVIQDGAPAVSITTERLARFVTVDDRAFRAADEGFTLAPGETRTVSLVARGEEASPRGIVSALNSHPVPYEFSA
jgi:beta-mannosidase